MLHIHCHLLRVASCDCVPAVPPAAGVPSLLLTSRNWKAAEEAFQLLTRCRVQQAVHGAAAAGEHRAGWHTAVLSKPSKLMQDCRDFRLCCQLQAVHGAAAA